jgi:putative NADH-flavin reductase
MQKGVERYVKIALFGASGNIGRRIAAEALRRGHVITPIARTKKKIVIDGKEMNIIKGDILVSAEIKNLVKEHDLVINATGPGQGDPQSIIAATRSLFEGMKKSGVRRLIAVGGAGSLKVTNSIDLVDTPQFPSSWKNVALAHRDALKIYRAEKELEWTYASPAGFIEPGKRTGKFRWGEDALLTDEKGESRISMEDFAVAVLDEAEQARHIRKRFTVAY